MVDLTFDKGLVNPVAIIAIYAEGLITNDYHLLCTKYYLSAKKCY